MKRLAHILLLAAAGASLVLCLTFCGALAFTRNTYILARHHPNPQSAAFLLAQPRRLCLVRQHIASVQADARVTTPALGQFIVSAHTIHLGSAGASFKSELTSHDPDRPNSLKSVFDVRDNMPPPSDGLAHVRRDIPTQTFVASSDAVAVPHWILIALTAVAPAVVAARALLLGRRARGRTAVHRCPSCGYDLCATPDRCPESGTSQTPAPTPS